MQTENKRTGLAWIIFFVSSAVFILAVALHWEYLTLWLRIICTSFVKGGTFAELPVVSPAKSLRLA